MFRLWFSDVLLRIRDLYWRGVYAGYRSRYSIPREFRFNGAGIQLYGRGKIHLGSDSYIGELSTMQAGEGTTISVGRRCRLSHNVRIYTSTADADADFINGPVGSVTGSVSIGDGAWVGANVFIGPGIQIGDNAVVGANSVVTRDIPSGEIWGGVPAKRLREKGLSAPGSA
jgi:maltose O-acetyltransferase